MRAGSGGQGSKTLGRPGGDGGDVVARAVDGMFSLRALADPSRKFVAGAGMPASRFTVYPVPGKGVQ